MEVQGKKLYGDSAEDWLRGLDLNQRPLGYESDNLCIFNKLENTDGTPNHRKEA
jgi:hypothetical protein